MKFSAQVQEVFALLSARGYTLSKPGWPVQGQPDVVCFYATRKMPADGTGFGSGDTLRNESNLDVTVRGGFASVDWFPETSFGRNGLDESGAVMKLLETTRRLR